MDIPRDFGLSGIAWVLTDLGHPEIGGNLLRLAKKHPEFKTRADLFFGISGYVLACINQWLETKHAEFLDEAIKGGEHLIRTSQVEPDGSRRWVDHKGQQWLGYAEGSSGIALALLRLYQATGNHVFLSVAEDALRYDYSQCVVHRGYKGLLRGVVDSPRFSVSHYWYDGIVGMAQTYAALFEETRDPEALQRAISLGADSFRPFAVFPGMLMGKSGIGNSLLNIWAATGNEEFYDKAFEMARRTSLYSVDLGGRMGMVGDQLFRLSNDYGTGAAGVALFLNRLVQREKTDYNFFLGKLDIDRAKSMTKIAGLTSATTAR